MVTEFEGMIGRVAMRTWAAVAAVAMLNCATVNAQGSGKNEAADTVDSGAPAAGSVAALERGRQFLAHSESFQLLPGVAALSGTDAPSVRSAMDKIGASASSQLATRGRYVLYRRGQQPGNAALLQVGMVRIHPAVVSTRTGAIGVLLGTIKVRLRNFGDRKAVASAYGLRIDSSFPELQTVFLSVPARKDILDAAAAVAADPRVQSASAEMLENVRVAE
jgi:hypothetical protein